MLVRTHDSRVMLADALRVRDPLGHVMRAESWILLGALTLGVSAHWVSHRIGRKLTR